MWGFRSFTPTCFSVVCRLFWAKGNQRPCGLIRNFYLSLKESKLGTWPVIRVITRNNFSDLAKWQGKLPIIEHLFLSSCNDLPPFEAAGCLPSPLAQSAMHTSFPFLSLNLSRMWLLWLSRVCVIPKNMYVIKFHYFLFLYLSCQFNY